MSTPTGTRAGTVDSPDTPHPSVVAMRASWQLCRDLFEGARAIKAAETTYVDRYQKEPARDYRGRLKRAKLYNGYKQVVLVGAGMLFQRAPVLSGASQAIEADWEDIDGAGTHGRVFMRRLAEDFMQTGRAGILVEYPSDPAPGARTLAVERALNLRPYWVAKTAEEILGWRLATENGVQVLRQLVLKETVEEEDGEFGVRIAERYRVLRRVTGIGDEAGQTRITWELWEARHVDGKRQVVPTGERGVYSGVTRIPFVLLTHADRASWGVEAPPLEELANLNLYHFQLSAEVRETIRITCRPVPVRMGYVPQMGPDGRPRDAMVTLGSSVLMDLPKDGAFTWAEATGTGIGPAMEELAATERQMAALGFSFLFPETRGVETAEAKRLDREAESATLISVADVLEDAANEAFQLHAMYRGEGVEPTIDIYKEFGARVLDPQLIAAISRLESEGQLTLPTLLRILQQGHIIPDDVDVDEEGKVLVGQAAAELVAAARAAEERARITAPGSGDPTDSDGQNAAA